MLGQLCVINGCLFIFQTSGLLCFKNQSRGTGTKNKTMWDNLLGKTESNSFTLWVVTYEFYSLNQFKE